MKKVLYIALLIIFSIVSLPSIAQNNSKSAIDTKSEVVEVYYFHYTRRCATCMAVETEAKKSLEKFFSNQVKAGVYQFHSLNLDDNDSAAKAKLLNVSGQTLLVVKGNKQENLTNVAFLNARTQPEKLHNAIKKAIETL